MLSLHIFLAYRGETTLEYSRFLRDQYLAELALKESGESPAKRKGFWTLFFTQSPCKKKSSRKIAPEAQKIETFNVAQ
jgi:hypothetical protein